MKRSELGELHYITAIENVGSILKHGILSFRRVQGLPHTSIAMNEIQERRAKVIVPGGKPLHEYACLYICGRNVMLFKRKAEHRRICVVRVRPEVIDLPNAVVTNGNASSDYVRFAAAPAGLRIVDRELTFAERWTDEDPVEYFKKKFAKCAEVLIPDRIDPRYLTGFYVSSEHPRDLLTEEIDDELEIEMSPHLFFL
jgi:ssDNA thymidine ADP-ribosyltransferase, DarT